ncbi:MAG: arginase [Flavobacteriaceae bacterium]|nr:arginase [Flavobacteriaceae bacterium]
MIIVKNRSDIGGDTRGSDMGIDALEVAAINAGNDFFNRHLHLDVKTHNETVYDKVFHSSAKRVRYVYQQCQRVKQAVISVLDKNEFPLILSGDHSSAIGSIAALRSFYPGDKLGVVWIDAHADLHSPLSSPSGNIHGMSVAACLGLDNLDYKRNKVGEDTMVDWNHLMNLGDFVPMIMPDDLVYFGTRSTESEELSIIGDLGIDCYRVHELRHRTFEKCLGEVEKKFSEVDRIYLSLDVDAMDCDLISDGTGTPVSKGFDIREVIEIISCMVRTKKLVAMEICEINPLLDTAGNSMAEATFQIIEEVFSDFF